MLKPGDYVAGTGSVVTGSVLDANPARIERALKFYDRQLYLKWNPKKRQGWGMWEVRRTPDQLTKVYQGRFNGQKLYTLERKELDLIAHVLDVAVLNDTLLGKLKSIDAWATPNFIDNLDHAAAKHAEAQKAKAREEMRYNIKQFKQEWKDFASLVSQGVNPADIIRGVKG